MTNVNNSIVIGYDDERTLSGAFTGAYQAIGSPLATNPVIMIFDNQSTVSVEISFNGTSTWKTFVAGQCLVLDCRANNGLAANMTFSLGTQIYCKGTGGSGAFKVSVLYARR